MYTTDEIARLLNRQGHAMVSIVGSGGKTTLLFQLLSHFRKQVSTLVSTTTMMYFPEAPIDDVVFLKGSKEPDLALRLPFPEKDSPRTLAIFDHAIGNKVKGVTPETIDDPRLIQRYPLILVESDGAKGKPLKAYAGHEPVIPQQVDLVVVVMGLDGLFAELSDTLVHRASIFSALTGLEPGETVTPEALVRILVHPDGFMKAVPPRARMILMLNKWDTLTRPVDFENFSATVFKQNERIQAVIVAALERHEEIMVYERGQFL